jgi:cobaltochelatase CobT
MIMAAQSPLWLAFRRRFTDRPDPFGEGGYRVFTTAFDETVNASDLPGILRKQSPMEAQSYEEAVGLFENGFTGERITLGAAAAELVRDLQCNLVAERRARSVVSFLIDHSGSMRGLRMLSSLLAVESAVDALDAAGIDTEILGFTTTGWKGGRARRAWRWAGRPRNPGRLCELRHIIYGAADRTVRWPSHVRLALRPDLLHENVDGEALTWAGSRLDPARWNRRFVCVVSDGAPVDDSTIAANQDDRLLARHLEAAESSLRAVGIVVGFLLIGRDHVREPVLYERAAEPEAAGLLLLRLIRRGLLPPALSCP